MSLRIVCLGNATPRFFPKTDKNKLAEHIKDMEEAPWTGGKCATHIEFSKDSSLRQCLDEARNIWRHHSTEVRPGWIAGNDPVLTAALKSEFGIKEERKFDVAFLPDGHPLKKKVKP